MFTKTIFICFLALLLPKSGFSQHSDTAKIISPPLSQKELQGHIKFYCEGGAVVYGDAGPWKVGIHASLNNNMIDIAYFTGSTGSVCSNSSGSFFIFIPIGESSGCLPTYEYSEFSISFSRIILKGRGGWISLSAGISVINTINRSPFDCIDSMTGLPPFVGTFTSHCKISETSNTYLTFPASVNFNWNITKGFAIGTEATLRISDQGIKPSVGLSILVGNFPE